ncbi:OB-fold protein [Terrisporobacter petrolearius]|uniref:OB-fold protein n=1 Tax=Terrisporobacter petrolearius TaxID=1460447 RepID=UPI0031CC6D1C
MGKEQKIKSCKACGKQLDGSAKICPECGKDQRNFFSKHKILTGIIVLIIIGALGSGGNTKTDKEVDTASTNTKQEETANKDVKAEKEQGKEKEDPIVVKASKLYRDYDSNEVKADKKYNDKTLEITGVVDDIGVSLGQTYVCLSTGEEYSAFSVQCFFDDDGEIDKVSELSKGDKITLSGTCTGMSMNVGVNDCKLK